MRLGLCAILALAGIALATPAATAQGRRAPNAETRALKASHTELLALFARVPLSAFDSTADGIESEEERKALLEGGKSESWELLRLPDALELKGIHARDNSVILKLVAHKGRVFGVFTRNARVSTVSLWREAPGKAELQPVDAR